MEEKYFKMKLMVQVVDEKLIVKTRTVILNKEESILLLRMINHNTAPGDKEKANIINKKLIKLISGERL